MSPQNKQARLEVHTNALQRLARKVLTVVAVIANFHRQRVIPLMERKLPIFKLTLEALYEGSRTLNVLLPHNIAAQRAKSVVAEFPDNPDDIWAIKMRPEEGYTSVVSLSFDSLSICAISSPLLAPDSVAFAGGEPQGQCLKAPSPGGMRSQPPTR